MYRSCFFASICTDIYWSHIVWYKGGFSARGGGGGRGAPRGGDRGGRGGGRGKFDWANISVEICIDSFVVSIQLAGAPRGGRGGGRGGLGAKKGGAPKVILEPHRHPGVFVAKVSDR